MNFALDEETVMFRDSVRKWVDHECPKDWCRALERKEHEYPHELWAKLVRAGYPGIGIDEQFGGSGGDIFIQAIFMREFSRTASGLAWIWGITAFSGVNALAFNGSDEQKRRFLPKMAAGELKAAISFTEAGGGTDLLGGMRSTAEKVAGGWIISGEKIWSTTADTADYLLLMARSDKNAVKRTQGLSLFFLPRASDGVTIRSLDKLGMRCLNSCAVNLDRVFVPDDLLIGEAGHGWRDSMKTLNGERIMMSAMCVGILDGVLEDAVAYMSQRRAFGRRIGEFQALQHYVADIAIWQKQAELMLYQTAWLLSQKKPCALEAAMTKTAVSEYACRAADLGISILGGMGYSADTDMQRYWRDARLLQIGPVSNEMARNMIAEGLGLPRSF
jgi:acyl-CoA dehydrogenase